MIGSRSPSRGPVYAASLAARDEAEEQAATERLLKFLDVLVFEIGRVRTAKILSQAADALQAPWPVA